jgi:hypothetical protein
MTISKSRTRFAAVALAAAAAFVSFSFVHAETAKVDFPKGYRYWVHIKSMILLENHPFAETFGGLHHVYANDAALEAMEDGTPYPDGAVLVFDLMEAITDTEGGTTSGGPRIRLDVMQKDAALFPGTNGWGYETFFGPDFKRIITDPVASCHGCHSSQESKDFVFSVFRK